MSSDDDDCYQDMPDLISDSEAEDNSNALVLRMYGDVIINWTACRSARPPTGVKLFFRREVKKTTSLRRIIAIAYIKQYAKNGGGHIFYQSSIFNETSKNEWREAFKQLIATTALQRLRDTPRAFAIGSYCDFESLHDRIRDECHRKQEPLELGVLSTLIRFVKS